MYTSFDNTGLLKVLSFLKSHKSEYLSGQDLSDVLKISRVAVWKHIKKIRTLGYTIESKQKRGYRFVKTTNQLLPWEVSSHLKTNYIGKRIYYFQEVDSTQNFALQIADNKKENGTLIIAEKQTNAKGRLNRKWISPKGGIWFSIILHPEFSIDESMLLPITLSLAISKAIQKNLRIKTNVRWPNDVTYKGKKVAGMLIDTSMQSNTIDSVIIGVGINYQINPKKIKKKIKNNTNYYGVDTLLNEFENTSQIHFIVDLISELEKNIDVLTSGKKLKIINEWTKNSETIHKNVIVNTTKGKISGIAQKIDNDGALKIKTKHGTEKIFVGDIILN